MCFGGFGCAAWVVLVRVLCWLVFGSCGDFAIAFCGNFGCFVVFERVWVWFLVSAFAGCGCMACWEESFLVGLV